MAWRQAAVVLLAGVALTAGATWSAARSWTESSERRLDLHQLRISKDLNEVVLTHTALLSAMRSLYLLGEGGLTQDAFQRFVAGGRLLEQYPGAQALEFARRIPSGLGTHADQWVVEYLEPVAGNETARGLDLGAEPSRRAAIEGACRADGPMATGPVRLVQERADSPGLVVFAPVYASHPPPASLAEREGDCAGLMIVVYRTVDMLAPVRDKNGDVDFEVYDLGPPASDAAAPELSAGPLFDSDGEANAGRGGGRRIRIDFHGRQWELVVTPPGGYLAGLAPPAVAVLAAGSVFTTVVSTLVFRLGTFRRRALARGQLVAAGERDRRSLERDLHDGAQQRLLSVALMLVRARDRVPAGMDAAELLSVASGELDTALRELRDLAQGLHPAVLTNHGLAVAVEGIAARAPMPVDVNVDLERPLPQSAEVAAYFVVCEAVANATKHARATRMWVSVTHARRRRLLVEVRDDGVGTATAGGGSGLRGLADRVEALDGRLWVTSRTGRGTRVKASIPCG